MPNATSLDGPVERRGVRSRVGAGRRPHPAEGGAGDDVLPDPGPQTDGHAVLGGDRQQELRMDGLHVAGLTGDQGDCPLRRSRGDAADGGNRLGGEHPSGVVDDALVDRVDLDRVHQVVGEEHDHTQAGEQQQDRAADRQPGELLGPLARGQPDGEQPRSAVDEGGDEHAEHDLGGAVPQEVPQQPGREGGRRQLQGDDREAEDEGDHRDHRAADGDQQRAGVVGGALEREPVEQ
jgi:hypothetical protein